MDMPLLPALELSTHPNPDTCIIWLHGLGADGYDFLTVVRELHLPDELKIRFVFPHAPMQPVTLNHGMRMRAWYDVALDGLERKPDHGGIKQSILSINDWITHELSRGIPPRRLFLAGFSQGGAVALCTGLQHPAPLGGILALSTYLPFPDESAAPSHTLNHDIPIFMAHGRDDSVIPATLGDASRKTLESRGYHVDWHIYPMAHSLCMDEVNDLSAWLQHCLSDA